MAEENRSDFANTDRGTAAAAPSRTAAEGRTYREARRRVLAGGLAGAPLMLTLSSRSAFASHCTISGMYSGNLSSGHDIECLGNTPGYWKTHEEHCSGYFYVGTCNPITDDNGQCEDYSVPTMEELEAYIARLREEDEEGNSLKIALAEEYLANLENFPNPASFFGTPFSTVFGEGCTDNPDTTLMQALWLDDTPPQPPEGLGGPSPVLAHSAAAWLNANEFGKEAYGLSPDEVIQLVQSMIRSDPLTLKDHLEMLNSPRS